jgi:hypothetical protein
LTLKNKGKASVSIVNFKNFNCSLFLVYKLDIYILTHKKCLEEKIHKKS